MRVSVMYTMYGGHELDAKSFRSVTSIYYEQGISIETVNLLKCKNIFIVAFSVAR